MIALSQCLQYQNVENFLEIAADVTAKGHCSDIDPHATDLSLKRVTQIKVINTCT